MLEDSISCSPGNDKKKSRSRRFHKKANKKSDLYNAKPTSNNIFPKELPSLEAIYDESTHSKTLSDTTQFEFFNPFENEKLLAAADSAEASTSSFKLKKITSNGFVRLESLPVEEENKIFPMKPPECPLRSNSVGTRSPILLGTETQFGITESELLRFCDEAETDVLTQPHSDARGHKGVKSIVDVILDDFCGSQIEKEDDLKTPKQTKSVVDDILADFCGSPTESEIGEKTPPKSLTNVSKQTKSIVDEILEDFCGSPYSKSPSNPNSEDSTPVFRFKSQPIRTYSRVRKKNKCARNIGSELNVAMPEDDGNISDSSSGLSVQEDFSQSVVPQLDNVDLNKSVKLCENLFNLSSYFSQVESTSNEKVPPVICEKSKDFRLSKIIEEIIKIKQKPFTINRNESEDEFRGFSDYDSDSKESTLKGLLEDEDDDDVLQQINCDSLCYDQIEPKVSFDHIDKDFENTLKNASAVIEQAKRLILNEDEYVEPKYSNNMHQTNCDMPKDIQNKSSTTSFVRDEQLFDDVDIWNDGECLLNYKTQNQDTKRIEQIETNVFNDELSKIAINTNNYDRAIYKENDFDRNTQKSNFDIDNSLRALPNPQRFQSSNDPCTSSSLRLIYKTQNQGAKRIEKIETNVVKYDSCKITTNTNSYDRAIYKENDFDRNTRESNFDIDNSLGALPIPKRLLCSNDPCTSSSLRPSIAQRTSVRITSKLKPNHNKEVNLKDKKRTETNDVSTSSNERLEDKTFKELPAHPEFVGFATASKKAIEVSDAAKQRANDFLKKFEQEDHEEKIEEKNNVISKEDINKNKLCHAKSISITEGTNFVNASSSGFAGHSTGHKNTVTISMEAAEIVNTFENKGQEKRVEDMIPEDSIKKKEEQCDIPAKDSRAISVTSFCFVGFSTASKKKISISDEAKLKADNLLKQFEQEEHEKRILEATDITPCKNKDEAVKTNTEVNANTSGFTGGFSTASKKIIPISVEAKRKADELLKKFEEAEREEEKSKDIIIEKSTQRHADEVSEEVRRKAQELLLDIEFFEEAFEDELKEIEALPTSQFQNKNQTAAHFKTSSSASLEPPKKPIFEGFKTASKKSINVSEEARQHAEQLLKTVNSQDLPEDFLKCIETELNKAIENVGNQLCSLMERDEQVDGAIKSPVHNLPSALNAEPEHLHARDNIEIEKRCSFNVSEERLFDHRNFDPTSERVYAKHENSYKFCQKSDANENAKTRKRKHSEGHIEDREKSPLRVTPRRLSCGERTPLNRINNALLYKTSSLPLKESTPNSAVISRKNLLSLSKRKKIKSLDQNVELSCRPKTPTNKQISSIHPCNTNSTPDLKGFFDSVSTSTPRLIRNNQISKNNENPPKNVSIDPDFQQIQWEDSNNSIRINRTSCVTDANVSFSQVSPSPKQRIEVLKMYGEPPAISPILMVNSCRPSGLRRGRRLMKP